MDNRDKMFADLHRLLNSKEFESEEELQKFLDGLAGKKIPSAKEEQLTPEVREAWFSFKQERMKQWVIDQIEADNLTI